MLFLESFIHRMTLAEIISRWMINRPMSTDVKQLKEIINFNSYIARIWVEFFTKDLAGSFYGKDCLSFSAKTKGILKDFVVKHPVYTTPQITRLIDRYQRYPEDFYRETPFDGKIYYYEGQGVPVFIGTTRIKRFRRIAEKGSRRIVDFLFERIRKHADDLAAERADRLGIIQKEQLITPQNIMIDEFSHAERRLIKSIRLGTIQSELPLLSIPDIVGVKFIVEQDQHSRFIETINALKGCTLIEKEEHKGIYNAINFRIAYDLPRELLQAHPPSGRYAEIMSRRGFNMDQIHHLYNTFLTAGEDQVHLELIVCNFNDFIESEIGKSMHEERILTQRANREYNSHLATNIRYLMNYMLTLCLAPSSLEYKDVPIKLWVKYMPDTIDCLIRNLYHVPADSSFDAPDDENTPDQSIRRTGYLPLINPY